jgi:hypothetical protein
MTTTTTDFSLLPLQSDSMDISAGVVVREGQLVRKGPELVSLVKYQEVFFVSLPPRLIIFLIYSSPLAVKNPRQTYSAYNLSDHWPKDRQSLCRMS